MNTGLSKGTWRNRRSWGPVFACRETGMTWVGLLRRVAGADFHAPFAVLQGHHIDGVEAADDRAVLAVAGEARVDVHLVGTRVDHVPALPCRVVPFREGPRGEPLRLHVPGLQDH